MLIREEVVEQACTAEVRAAPARAMRGVPGIHEPGVLEARTVVMADPSALFVHSHRWYRRRPLNTSLTDPIR
jgi:hypothetical protein